MSESVTELLEQIHRGDRAAFDRLIPLVYVELHSLARSFLSQERDGHTLQPTALVHETYLKLVDRQRARWEHRAHFFAAAAQTMRRILVDHARARGRVKRGGGDGVSIASAMPGCEPDLNLLALDEALNRLMNVDAGAARVVELRYFAGLTIAETAVVLGVSDSTVESDWRYARAWLYRELCKGDSRDGGRSVQRS